MKPSRTVLLIALAGLLAGCGETSASNAAFTSKYPECPAHAQAVYDYLRTGVDNSADHTFDVGYAQTRADIVKQPSIAQDGLMRAAAEKDVQACEARLAPTRAIPVGPGVTADTINLGIITDLSGIFAGYGHTVSQGGQLFWHDQNAKGGVCGRKVNLIIRDHGYNVQNAVGLYLAMQPQVLAFQQLLGSPETAALVGHILGDAVLTMPVSWSSKLLSNPYIVLTGTTYDLEMINAVDWLMRNKGLHAGDRIADIYLEGEFGGNALSGTEAAAKANRLTLVEQQIHPADKDLTPQVRAIRAAGIHHVLMTSTPGQMASVAAAAAAMNYDLTIVGSNPVFDPSLLNGPNAAAVEKSFYVVQSYAPYSDDDTGPATIRSEYSAAYPNQPVSASSPDYGYGQAEIMYRILDAACKSGSLERSSLLRAFHTLASVDTDGLIAPLNYSVAGAPPARQVFVAQPDPKSPGGLRLVQGLFASPFAQTYQPS